MTTYPMHFTDNAFSWRRLAMLCQFYWPGLKRAFLLFALAPFVVVLIAALIAKISDNAVDPLIMWPIGLLAYFSPVMLITRDYRDVSNQLPVTAGEKFFFLILLIWVAVPGLLAASSELGNLLSCMIFGPEIKDLLTGYQHYAIDLMGGENPASLKTILIINNYVSPAATASIILYYVVIAKRHRFLAAILSYLGIQLLLGITFGSVGAVVGFILGYTIAKNGAGIGSVDQIVQQVLEPLVIGFLSLAIVVMLVLTVIFLTKLYKRLRNCGF